MLYAKHEQRDLTDMEAAADSMGLRLPDHLRSKLPDPASPQHKQHEIPEWWFDRNALPQSGTALKRYVERGTGGYAEDKKKYNREWMRRRRAEENGSCRACALW